MATPNEYIRANIPDLSLGDRQDRPTPPPLPPPAVEGQIQRADADMPLPPRPVAKTDDAPIDWCEGDRVLAPWEPTYLYPGRIRQIVVDEDKGDQALIRFDDGGEGWVFLFSLASLELAPGRQVQARRGTDPQYLPGEIAEIDGDDICVEFDDGRSEWAPVERLRFPCVANGPAAVPTQFAPWQAATSDAPGGFNIPSWLVTVLLLIVVALLRAGCRVAMN